jgi:hypothetical protein
MIGVAFQKLSFCVVAAPILVPVVVPKLRLPASEMTIAPVPLGVRLMSMLLPLPVAVSAQAVALTEDAVKYPKPDVPWVATEKLIDAPFELLAMFSGLQSIRIVCPPPLYDPMLLALSNSPNVPIESSPVMAMFPAPIETEFVAVPSVFAMTTAPGRVLREAEVLSWMPSVCARVCVTFVDATGGPASRVTKLSV